MLLIVLLMAKGAAKVIAAMVKGYAGVAEAWRTPVLINVARLVWLMMLA